MKSLGLFNLTVAVSLGLGLASLLLISASALAPEKAPSLLGSDGRLSQLGTRGVTLTRGPYLQSVTTNSMMVVWETTGVVSGQVDYGPTAAYGVVVSSTIPVTHHALVLMNLSPYSLYHYQASSGGQAMGGDGAFRTVAPPTLPAFSFVAFGDTSTNIEAHQSVVDRIVTLSPDFVLHSGDFVEDGNSDAEWTTFFTIEQNLLRQSPLFGVLGNHEKNSANYFEAFHLPGNERWYSFDYGDAHFIALQVDGYADSAPGSSQYAWLVNDLANTDRQWKIVFFHIPPYTPDLYDTFVPLFAQYGVDLVFNGHDHVYERGVISDVVYIISGGGGEPLDERPPIPGSAYFTSTYHCVSVTINGRSLTSVGVRPDGVEFDLFTLYAPPMAGSNSSSPDWLGQITVFTNATVTSGTTTYQWTLGDGVTSTLENPTHTYTFPSVFTVVLTATNIAGSSVATDSITLYGPPTANFAAFPLQGIRPLTVAFTDATTTIPLGDPTLTYLWRLGDGGPSSLPNLTHTFTVAGTYTVTLTVSNAAGSDTVTRAVYIAVSPIPVRADFAASPISGTVPLHVVFTNTSVGDYTDSLWDFNHVTSTLENPTRTFTAVGEYTVTLTASGPGGSDTKTRAAFIQVGRQSTYLPLILSDRSKPRLGQALSHLSLHHRRR